MFTIFEFPLVVSLGTKLRGVFGVVVFSDAMSLESIDVAAVSWVC